jgi:hypothetical protein
VCQTEYMAARLSLFAKKGLALLVLLAVCYLLFKVVLGIVAGVVWILIIALAVVGVIWAVRVL